MILTKPLVCLVPTSDYANALAEPRYVGYVACHGENRTVRPTHAIISGRTRILATPYTIGSAHKLA
jgi:hypothetical protein